MVALAAIVLVIVLWLLSYFLDSLKDPMCGPTVQIPLAAARVKTGAFGYGPQPFAFRYLDPMIAGIFGRDGPRPGRWPPPTAGRGTWIPSGRAGGAPAWKLAAAGSPTR